MKKAFLIILASLFFYAAPALALDPIVFVHGFSGNTRLNFTTMISRFKSAGYPSNYLYAYNYNSLTGVISGANTLKNKVDDCLAKTGKKKVDLVCHSMGGLVARYYMKYLGGAAKVNQVVYIATPHKGTDWAYTVPLCQSTKDMRPGSALLRSISGYSPGLSLWSSCDEIVIPHSSANYGYAIGVGCWGHIAITYSTNVFNKTRDFIKP